MNYPLALCIKKQNFINFLDIVKKKNMKEQSESFLIWTGEDAGCRDSISVCMLTILGGNENGKFKRWNWY